jgi:peptide/nickel transport system ATP-binding protein
MCERLMVMNKGEVVEFLTSADLAARRTAHAYTQQLMEASVGFKRSAAP